MPPDDTDFESPTTELIQTDQLDLHTFQPSEAASVSGISASKTPALVAMPLPPLNFSQQV